LGDDIAPVVAGLRDQDELVVVDGDAVTGAAAGTLQRQFPDPAGSSTSIGCLRRWKE
jgi:hypothetical protein